MRTKLRKKKEPGKSVQFKPKVTLKTIHTKLKNGLEEIHSANKEGYLLRNSEFVMKPRLQKQQQIHHRLRPLTTRHKPMVHHVHKTLQGENSCQS